MDQITIDIDRLYRDLLEHFGTSQFWCGHSWGPTHSSNPLMDRMNGFAGDRVKNSYTGARGTLPRNCGVPIAEGALADIDTAYQTGNYDRLVALARAEGFELTKYTVT